MTHKQAGRLAVNLSSEGPPHVAFEMIRELGVGINVKYQAQELLVPNSEDQISTFGKKLQALNQNYNGLNKKAEKARHLSVALVKDTLGLHRKMEVVENQIKIKNLRLLGMKMKNWI